MENTLNTIESLFEQLLVALKNHNEVFFVENEDDYGYLTPDDDKEVELNDYQVYFEIDKYGYGNAYAISKLENGIAYLIGSGENDDEKEISIENFNMGELFDLGRLCNFTN